MGKSIKAYAGKALRGGKLAIAKQQIRKLESEIEQALSFVRQLEKSDKGEVINTDSTSELMEALDVLRNKLNVSGERDKKATWINEGLNKFIDTLKAESDTQKLYDQLISSTVKYVNANQGGIYILNNEDEANQYLALRACYAYDRKKHLNQKISLGEGLVGQCLFEKETIYLKDVPADYVNITSGLGEATPRNIIVLPLIYNERVLGVLELASFKILEDFEVKFLEKLAENIGFAINDLNNVEQTSKLLEEAHMYTEQMKAQEEMMIQNMEELQATQEEMARNQKYLKASQLRNKVYFENAHYGIVAFHKDGKVDDANKEALGIFKKNIDKIKGSNIDQLIDNFKMQNIERYVGLNKRVQISNNNTKLKAEMIINKVMIDDQEFYVAYINGDISKDLKKEKELAKSLMEMDEQKRFMAMKQRELENSQRLSHAFFENSNDAIITCNEDGDLFEINSAALRLLNIEGEEAFEQNMNTFIPMLDLQNPVRFLNRRTKIKMQQPKGGAFKAELFLAKELVNEQTIFMAYIRDISGELTKQRELAKSLMELDELKTKLHTYKLN